MEIYGKGSPVRLEDKDRNKCRKWRLVVQTSEGVKTKRVNDVSYKQALKELERFKGELSTPAGQSKFKDRSALWLERREKSGERTPETLKKDRQLVSILNKKFGKKKMCDLDTSTVTDGLLDIKEVNGYSASYANMLHKKMKAILKEAVRDGEIASNPLENVPAPKIPKTTRCALSQEQYDGFMLRLEQFPLDAHTMAVRIAIWSALRRGEIVGLIWDDVDFSERRLYVHASVTDTDRMKQTKNYLERYVPMPTVLVDSLREWQSIQARQLASLGIKQTLSTPVITSDVGTRMRAQNLNRWWRRNRDELGVPDVVIHELRHTYLTRLGNCGDVPANVIKSIAGWTTLDMADTYIHDDEVAKQQAVDGFFGDHA